MAAATFPSTDPAHRHADMIVHGVGLALILGAGGMMLIRALQTLPTSLILSVAVYVLCALASNMSSTAYHFAPQHDKRAVLRRIDHSAIYLSITGTFTPFFVLANTGWTLFLLWLCWGLTALAVWNKITNSTIKSRWSTASYLALGGLGLCALPHLTGFPISVLWCVLAGASGYVIGTVFYARKGIPYRYAIWHMWVNVGAMCMFIGLWIALFAN